jgi:hypothetical protein
MHLLVSVVEIDGTAGVIVLAVFVSVFLVVAGLAWLIVRNTTISTDKSTPGWRLSTNIPLPVSRPAAFDRLTDAMAKGASRPSLASAQRRFMAGLSNTRKKLATGHRLGLIVAGIGGIVLSMAIYRDYRDDEMILLPVAIIFLVSLGVLLSGVIPSRTVDPIEPIDPALLNNLQLNVSTEPLTIQFDDEFAKRAMDMLSSGISPEEVTRQIAPGDGLDERTRQQVERAIALLRHR